MKTNIFLACFFTLLVAGCKDQGTQQPDSIGPFSSEVKPILDRGCGGSSCHGGGPNGYAGGLDLTSYEGIFRGSPGTGTVVVSGNPYMSHLLQVINRSDTVLSPISVMQMPLSRDPLPVADVQTVANWIRDGARDDHGNLPFPEPRPNGKIFFTSQSVDLVGVLDPYTGLIMRYVSVGNQLPMTSPPQAPHNVLIDDQGQNYYVTLITAGKLKKFDAATNELLGTVDVGTSPAHMVLTLDGSKIYITNFNLSVGQIFAVNTSTMTVSNVITAGSLMNGTHGARLSHDGRFLYVGNNGRDLLTVVRTSNDSVVAHIPVAADVPPIGSFVYKPYQVAVRGDDRFIYVTNSGMASVSVIERTGDTFGFVKTIPVGQSPFQCEVTRDQRFLYVCNRGSQSVTVIKTDSNVVLTTIQNVGKQPHGIDITEDSRTAYVTCENILSGDPPHHATTGGKDPAFIAIIDVNTNTVIRRVEVGGFAAGVSVFPGKGN